MLQHLLDRLPAHCLLCGAWVLHPLPLCPACVADLPRNHHPCPRCALPHSGPADQVCGGCLRHPPPWQRAWAPLRYAEPLSALIGALKFHGRLGHARALGTLLCQLDPPEGPPGLLLPVPLHPKRLAERGYNQALELARRPAHHAGLALAPHVLQRVLHTPPQSQLSAAQRRGNLRGAFRVQLPQEALAEGRRIVLFDDVITTGSTLAELTRTLQRAGANQVEVWALARAGRERG